MRIFKLINVKTGGEVSVQADELKLKPPVYYFYDWKTVRGGTINIRHEELVAYYPIRYYIVKG